MCYYRLLKLSTDFHVRHSTAINRLQAIFHSTYPQNNEIKRRSAEYQFIQCHCIDSSIIPTKKLHSFPREHTSGIFLSWGSTIERREQSVSCHKTYALQRPKIPEDFSSFLRRWEELQRRWRGRQNAGNSGKIRFLSPAIPAGNLRQVKSASAPP